MLIDLTDKKYGKLTVIKRTNNQGKRTMWLCKCECGKEKAVGGDHLKRGEVVSCGCYGLEKVRKMAKEKRVYNRYEIKDDCVIGYDKETTFKFDKDDYEKVAEHYWRKDRNGYMMADIGRKQIRLHKFIMPFNGVIDHINGQIRDDRKCNLRKCTMQENSRNHKVFKNSKSGVTGVVYKEKIKRWVAVLTNNYKQVYLGCFKTKEEAITARKEGEKKYFGEFIRTIE